MKSPEIEEARLGDDFNVPCQLKLSERWSGLDPLFGEGVNLNHALLPIAGLKELTLLFVW